MTDRIFRFVLNEQVPTWESFGWKAHVEALRDTHHGFYSTLMEWAGKGHPVEPDKADCSSLMPWQ